MSSVLPFVEEDREMTCVLKEGLRATLMLAFSQLIAIVKMKTHCWPRRWSSSSVYRQDDQRNMDKVMRAGGLWTEMVLAVRSSTLNRTPSKFMCRNWLISLKIFTLLASIVHHCCFTRITNWTSSEIGASRNLGLNICRVIRYIQCRHRHRFEDLKRSKSKHFNQKMFSYGKLIKIRFRVAVSSIISLTKSISITISLIIERRSCKLGSIGEVLSSSAHNNWHKEGKLS